jgi:FAD/FMN-containing dehydrogenase
LRRGPCPAPLFVTPEETLALGVGLFASFAPSLRAAAHAQVTAFAKQLQALGGARYLSGYVTYAGAAEWEQHYGDAWAGFARAKRLYDPGSQLNPGFVHWL